MCPPDRDERRNRSPTIFIFEGSDGEGTDAHPLWGPRARFWAGRADGPSQRSTHPLVPSKTKVAAERCRSGAEVWTCPPDRNERRNRSPTIFIFEGSDGEGTDAHPLWGPRARFWAGRADGPSQRSTHPLVPSKTKVAAERCRSGAEVWTCPPDRNERRNRSPTIFIFEGSDGEGTDAHPLWGPRARFWAGRADGPSQRSTHPLAPSKTKVAAERCRSGAEVWTCPPDRNERRNRSPTIFIFEGSDGEGTDAHPLWGARARFWAGRADGPSQGRLTRSLPRKRKSRQSAAVLGPRCGRVPLTGTSDGIAPRRFSFSRGRTGKGLTLTRSGALVHVSGQAVRTALLRARLTRSLPRKRKSRQSAAVLGPRCGRVPQTGTSDGIAPRRFSFSRGRTGKGLTLTRSGALVHVSGQAVRTALLRARLPRSLPRKRKSRQSAAVLGPRCGRVPQTGTSDGIAPRRFSFSRGRTGKGLTLTRSGALVHVSGQAVRTALLSGRLTRSLPRKRKSRQSAAVLGPRCGRVPQTGTSDGIAPRRFSFSRGRTGKGLTLTRSGALVHVSGQAVRTALLSGRLTRSLPRKRKSRQSAAVLGPRCGRVPQTGTSDGIAPRRFSFSRGRTGKGLTLTRSGALVHVSGQAVRTSQRSTQPLAPSKTKVAAERCRSGAEVWTCPPDRNERRNRSPTIFIFEGSDGEGTDARPLWGPRARFWAGRADGPSQRLDSPARSLENESRGRALPFWGRGVDVSPRLGRATESLPDDFHFRGVGRGRD